MANINNEGVLFRSIEPVNGVSYIAISTSWFDIYEQAAQKLLAQWSSLDQKYIQKTLSDDWYTVDYLFKDLDYYWRREGQLNPQDFKTIKLYTYDSGIDNFFITHRKIITFLNRRNLEPALKSLFPTLGFPVTRFRRAGFPNFIHENNTEESGIKILVKQFDRSNTIGHQGVFTPDRRFFKDRNFDELLSPLELHTNHLTDLTAVINHLIDIKHFSSSAIEDILEQIIDDNLGLLSKLRPGFSIRPELAKKILLKKLI